ncbi:hypothetical protein L9F63_021954, partial [Diploptera punctata]
MNINQDISHETIVSMVQNQPDDNYEFGDSEGENTPKFILSHCDAENILELALDDAT